MIKTEGVTLGTIVNPGIYVQVPGAKVIISLGLQIFSAKMSIGW